MFKNLLSKFKYVIPKVILKDVPNFDSSAVDLILKKNILFNEYVLYEKYYIYIGNTVFLNNVEVFRAKTIPVIEAYVKNIYNIEIKL